MTKLIEILIVVATLIVLAFVFDCEEKTEDPNDWVIFDVDCICGNHLHAEPHNPQSYKYVCNVCDKIYENNYTQVCANRGEQQ